MSETGTDANAPRTGVWFFPDAESRRTVALAAAAERLGLEELWLGDEGPARDPFGLLAAAAGVTERLLLGIAVTNPYLRHPAMTAVAAMTVHELSGGRVLLGIGPGGGIALNPVGVPRIKPLTRTREAVRIIRAVADGRITDGYTPPPRPFTTAAAEPRLPIWIGARGERFNRYASEAADGAFVAGIPMPLHETVIGWARSIRPIEIALYVSAVFDPSEVEAVRPRLVFSLLDAPAINRERLGLDTDVVRAAAVAYGSGDSAPARSLITDKVLDQILLRGTPADVGARLAGIVRTHRPTSVGFSLLTPNLERGLEDSAEAFAVLRRQLATSAPVEVSA